MERVTTYDEAVEAGRRLRALLAEVAPLEKWEVAPTATWVPGGEGYRFFHWPANRPTTRKALALKFLKEGKGGVRIRCITHAEVRYAIDIDCDGVFAYDVARDPFITCGRP